MLQTVSFEGNRIFDSDYQLSAVSTTQIKWVAGISSIAYEVLNDTYDQPIVNLEPGPFIQGIKEVVGTISFKTLPKNIRDRRYGTFHIIATPLDKNHGEFIILNAKLADGLSLDVIKTDTIYHFKATNVLPDLEETPDEAR